MYSDIFVSLHFNDSKPNTHFYITFFKEWIYFCIGGKSKELHTYVLDVSSSLQMSSVNLLSYIY
jgi:hypothetical protein